MRINGKLKVKKLSISILFQFENQCMKPKSYFQQKLQTWYSISNGSQMDSKTVVQWWLRLLPQLLLWSTLQVQSIELIFANRKSGHSRVLSQNNLVGDFLGNQKLHTKNGLKTKGNGLITWYLPNVMKMCSFEIPPQTRSAWRLWGLRGWMPKQYGKHWLDVHRIIEQWHSPKSDLSTSRSALKRIHPDSPPDLNRTWCWILLAPMLFKGIRSNYRQPQESKTTTISCHIPGPRFLPSLAPYLRSNASSCDG